MMFTPSGGIALETGRRGNYDLEGTAGASVAGHGVQSLSPLKGSLRQCVAMWVASYFNLRCCREYLRDWPGSVGMGADGVRVTVCVRVCACV